jgi:MFS family permease
MTTSFFTRYFVSLFLWLTLGIFGVHRLYLGLPCKKYCLTLGFFGFGWLADLMKLYDFCMMQEYKQVDFNLNEMEKIELELYDSICTFVTYMQFPFFLMWTTYAAFLPQLIAQAGLDAKYFFYISIMDNVCFIVMNPILAFAAERVGKKYGKFGLFFVLLVIFSSVNLICISLVAGTSQSLFFICTLLWSLSSSILRAPPIFLLFRHIKPFKHPKAIAISTIGMTVGGCVSPYIVPLYTDYSAWIPFSINALMLVLTSFGVIFAERQLERTKLLLEKDPNQKESEPEFEVDYITMVLLFVGIFFVYAGFEGHTNIRSLNQYTRFASDKASGRFLAPTFWISNQIGMKLMALFLINKVHWKSNVLIASCLGGIGCLMAEVSNSLGVLVVANIFSGLGYGMWYNIVLVYVPKVVPKHSSLNKSMVLGFFYSCLSAAAILRFSIASTKVATELNSFYSIASSTFWFVGVFIYIVMFAYMWHQNKVTRSYVDVV